MFKSVFYGYSQLFEEKIIWEKEKIALQKIATFNSMQCAWSKVISNYNIVASCKLNIYLKKFRYLFVCFLFSATIFFLGSLFKQDNLDLLGLVISLFVAILFATFIIDDMFFKKDNYLEKKYEYADFVKDVAKTYARNKSVYQASFLVRQKYNIPYNVMLTLEKDLTAVKIGYFAQLENQLSEIYATFTSTAQEVVRVLFTSPKRLLKYTFSVIIKL